MTAITSVFCNGVTCKAGSRFFGRLFHLTSHIYQFQMIGMCMRTPVTLTMPLELLFMTLTTVVIRGHYELFVIFSMATIATDYLFPFRWRPVFTLLPLSHNTRVFRRMTGNTLLIGKFTGYGTARMKGFRIKIICRVIPSYHRQKSIEMSELPLPRKEFLWACVITCKPTCIVYISRIVWSDLFPKKLSHLVTESHIARNPMWCCRRFGYGCFNGLR